MGGGGGGEKIEKNITYYIYDLMRYTQPYGTILALFSNVTYYDKNVSKLWHEEKLSIKCEISI
jgi:hypothetical protein